MVLGLTPKATRLIHSSPSPHRRLLRWQTARANPLAAPTLSGRAAAGTASECDPLALDRRAKRHGISAEVSSYVARHPRQPIAARRQRNVSPDIDPGVLYLIAVEQEECVSNSVFSGIGFTFSRRFPDTDARGPISWRCAGAVLTEGSSLLVGVKSGKRIDSTASLGNDFRGSAVGRIGAQGDDHLPGAFDGGLFFTGKRRARVGRQADCGGTREQW